RRELEGIALAGFQLDGFHRARADIETNEVFPLAEETHAIWLPYFKLKSAILTRKKLKYFLSVQYEETGCQEKIQPQMYWNLSVIMIDFRQDVKQDLPF
ncbi:MAG TPA: hypothetical protein VJ837_06260, partial [Candidatus Paceibacterota bacterium]|nr:hypothetical protein [Candidatus Paceibacterota bacterium]